MKVRIQKSAGVIFKNDIIVVQLGKVLDLPKPLASHLVKNNIAVYIQETKDEKEKLKNKNVSHETKEKPVEESDK